jgi:hypothetical protein
MRNSLLLSHIFDLLLCIPVRHLHTESIHIEPAIKQYSILRQGPPTSAGKKDKTINSNIYRFKHITDCQVINIFKKK